MIGTEIVRVAPDRWRVRSAPDRPEHIVYSSGKAWGCDCDGWQHRQMRYVEYKCRHIRGVEEFLAAALARPTEPVTDSTGATFPM